MEIHHVIQAAMMSRAPEKKSRMINPSPQEKETCKDWLEKKRFPLGITTAGARGSFAPRDLMSSVKLTKLVWKKKRIKTSSFHPLPLHCSSP